MPSALAQQIIDAVHAAMRAHDRTRLDTLRLLQAAIKQKAVDARVDPDDAAIQAIVEKQAKQRRESIEAFESAGRHENAAKEAAELDILQEFLPQPADEQTVQAAIDAAIATVGAQGQQGPAAMGAVMRELKAKLAGRADLRAVSARVREQLAGADSR